jgi:DNA polymerase-3 subunit delta'
VPIIPLHAHAALRARLAHAATSGTLPESLLLTGPRGVGKQRLGLWLAQLLLCAEPESGPCGHCQSCRFTAELRHPDLHWVFPRPRLKDGDARPEEVREDYADATADRVKHYGLYAAPSGSEGIFVYTVRAIVQSASMSPALGKRKVLLVGDADRMVPQEGSEFAANAFLKLLEEPPADTRIILTSSEPGALLPTIRSRVVTVRVPPLTNSEVTAFLDDEHVKARLQKDGVRGPTEELAALAAGAPGRLFSGEAWSAALEQARSLLEAATGADRTLRYRAAMAQGVAKSRGSFSDMLDALTLLLRERVREAVGRSDESGAIGAARAVEAVEVAKERAQGNLSPQLIGAILMSEIGSHLA